MRTIAEMPDRVGQTSAAGLDRELIMVDDGSTDGTRRYLGRVREKDTHWVLYLWYSMGNRALTLLAKVFTNRRGADLETGYKLPTPGHPRSVPYPGGWLRVRARLRDKGGAPRCCGYETGMSYPGRTYEGARKITWRDGVGALWWIVDYSGLVRG